MLHLSSFVVLGLPACVVILSLQSLWLRFSAGLHELHPLSVFHLWEDCWSKLSSGLFSGTRRGRIHWVRFPPGVFRSVAPLSLLMAQGRICLNCSPGHDSYLRLTLCHCCLAQEQMERASGEDEVAWPSCSSAWDQCVSCPWIPFCFWGSVTCGDGESSSALPPSRH